MKIPLPAQLTNAERIRDSLRTLRDEGVEITEGYPLQERLDCQEATCLTLAWLQTYETPFRQFMAQRSKEAACS